MENTNNPSKERNTQIIVFIIGLLVGLGIGFLIFSGKEGGLTFFSGQNEENSAMNKDNPTEFKNGTVTVSDQKPGNIVTINKVTLTTPSWIAIYDDLNDAPGSILGARYFDTGNYANEIITLQVGTIAGSKYYAVVHTDDGQIIQSEFGHHEFDHTKDLANLDSQGNKINYSFMTISTGARGL